MTYTTALRETIMTPLCFLHVSLLISPVDARQPTTFDTSKTVYASGTEYAGRFVSVNGRQFGILKYEDGRQTDELIVFEMVDVLYSGKLTVNKTGEAFGYGPSDLITEDFVRVNFILHSSKKYAFEICICERPGKKVPPSNRLPYNGGIAYHEQKNVWNDVQNGAILQESTLRFHGFHKEADRIYGKKELNKKDDVKAPAAAPSKDKSPTEKK
jgi:hypothetical protein